MLVNCDQCGIATDKRPRDIRRFKHYFCSWDCRTKYFDRRVYVPCKFCGTQVFRSQAKARKPVFCSSSCSAKYHNPNRLQARPSCIQCMKTLDLMTGKFCSNKCQGDYQYLKYVERWLAGVETGGFPKLSRHIKRWLVIRDGEKCNLCGWNGKNPVTGNIAVEIDHVDGNPRNNRPDNLRFLCPNCHSLTPTYGALNKGNGRTSARKNMVIETDRG